MTRNLALRIPSVMDYLLPTLEPALASQATYALIDGVQWVSPISPTASRVPARAMDFQHAQFRRSGFSQEGVWAGLDWTEGPDWFDLSVHWRGYTPKGILTNLRWATDTRNLIRIGQGVTIKSKVAERRRDEIKELRRHLDSMVVLLELAEDDIPCPETLDLVPLIALHQSEADALRTLAAVRFHYIDLIAFYCWIHAALRDEPALLEWHEDHAVPSPWEVWECAPKTGFLIDLSLHFLTHSLPTWCKLGIPVHYNWGEELAAYNRFYCWSPEALGAINEWPGGEEPAKMERELEVGIRGVDEWTQDWELCPATYQADRIPQELLEGWVFFVKDFEGWKSRRVNQQGELEIYERKYSAVDAPNASPPSRTYHRFCLRPELVGTTIDLLNLTSFLLPLPLLRERFKFKYGSSVLHLETSTPTKTLLSRIGQGPSQSGSESRSSSPRGRSREIPLRKRICGAARERSASPRRSYDAVGTSVSLRARGSSRTGSEDDSTTSVRALSFSSRVSSPAASSANGSTSDPLSTSARGREAALSLLPRQEDQPYPFDFTTGEEWNRAFLEEAVIHFPWPNAQWRIRSWLLQDPDIPLTILLSRALSYFIPFQLEVPMGVMHRFMRTKASCAYSDVAAGIFYKANYIGNLIQYTKIGVNYVAAYKTSALGILAKPNLVLEAVKRRYESTWGADLGVFRTPT